MFRDLKEYQEIQRIYQDNVYDSPDDKLFEEAFKEFNTLEELDYLEENIEYVCEKQNFIQKGLQYINRLRKGLKTVKPKTNIKPKDVSKELDNAKKIIQKSDTAIKPNNKVTDIVKSNPKKVDTPKVDTSKIKGDKSGVEKIKDIVKKNPIKTGAAATGALVTTAALTPGGEEKKDETPKVEEKPKEEPKVEVKKEEPKKEKKKKEKPLLSTPMKDTTELGSKVRQVKPGSSRDKMIASNEVRHGSDHIVNLRNQNADFQAMKKGKITKAEFIAKYPKSQTAKKHKMKNIKKGIKSSYDPIYNNNLANNLAEVYRNMYNTPAEPEVLDEGMGTIKVIKAIPKIKKALGKPSPKGSEPSPNSLPDAPSKPSPDVKRTEPTKPDLKRTEPKRPTGPTTPKPRPDKGGMGPTGGESQRREAQMKKPAKMSKEDFGFDAYDLILEYLLGTEQVETIEEANYVMTEMDDQTIHSIVTEMEDALNEINEGMMGNVAKGAGSMIGGAVDKVGSMGKGVVKGGMSGAKAVAKKLMDAMKKVPKTMNNPMPKGGGTATSATGGYM